MSADGTNKQILVSDYLGYYGYGVTLSYNIANSLQLFASMGRRGIFRIRAKHQDTGWSDWMWINPPVLAGQEYLTTERWFDIPVYTTLIDCGDASDGKQIDISNLNASIVLRSESITDGRAPYL